MVLGAISASTNALYTDTFTGNGSTTAYALGITPVDLNAIEVYLNGLYQNVSTLTLSGNTVTFATAPPSGVIIEIRSVGFLNSGGTLAPATLTGGTGINVTTNSPNNFTIANTLGGGIDWDTNIKTATFSANPGRGYIVNTTGGEVTLNLPAGVPGNIVAVQDYAGTFDTNNLIISANGSEKIQARSTDAKSTTENASIYLLYQDATRGWTADNIIDNPPTFNVSYLVIAGAGGGGFTAGGGGGAGGLRTSYGSTTGGGGSSESVVAITPATNYTLTVGAGGAGSTSSSAKGSNGSNSVFASITSTGGGGGGTRGSGLYDGAAGGSGGGEGGDNSGDGGAAVTSPVVQGYAGGSNTSGGTGGAGGGGASAIGSEHTAPGGNSGGNGGAGLAVSITGSSVTYAGGGGGGGQNGADPGFGGAGGGADGGTSGGGSNGTANTGGGGGGDGNLDNSGGTGGSGVVILRYPNTFTISGLSGTTTTSGSDKITTFTNAGTGNIQFN